MALALYRPEQVQAQEQSLAAAQVADVSDLMLWAAQALLAAIGRYYPKAQRLAIVCGSGNNAGDGYLLAVLAQQSGLQVSLHAVAPPKTPLAKQQAKAWQDLKGPKQAQMPLAECLQGADLVIDALLGIGLVQAPNPPYAATIEAVNLQPAPVLAVDVPSGLCARTGHCPGAAVKAELTLCMLVPKMGLYTGQAMDHCGQVLVADFGLAHHWRAVPVSGLRLQAKDLKPLPPRPSYFHKGMAGSLNILAGNCGMAGAAALAGLAALRSGVGRVKIYCHPSQQQLIAGFSPDLMVAAADKNDLLQLAATSTLLVGPGLGQDAWAQEVLAACSEFAGDLVLDADALNLYALGHRFAKARTRTATPHPLEAARLLSLTVAQVECDRFASAQALAADFDAILLKGAGSIVVGKGWSEALEHSSLPEPEFAILGLGNPGMAVAGMGDVLAGITASLIAQGLPVGQAMLRASIWHSAAADRAVQELGPLSLISSDLIRYLPQAIQGH